MPGFACYAHLLPVSGVAVGLLPTLTQRHAQSSLDQSGVPQDLVDTQLRKTNSTVAYTRWCKRILSRALPQRLRGTSNATRSPGDMSMAHTCDMAMLSVLRDTSDAHMKDSYHTRMSSPVGAFSRTQKLLARACFPSTPYPCPAHSNISPPWG